MTRLETLASCFGKVRAFHRAMGHPAPNVPTLIPGERVEQRHGFSDEENTEFKDARTIVDQADAAIDKLYFALGDLVELGLDPSPLFDIVHDANMAKLGPDGNPFPHPTIPGKTGKPPGWQRPEPWLTAEVERQVNLSNTANPKLTDFDPIRYGCDLASINPK